MKIQKIFLLERNSEEEDITATKDNKDVVLLMENGEKYIASFYTYESIEAIRKENTESGNNLNGRFFWSKYMILTDSCELESITQIVEHLIDEGDFKDVFGLLSTNTTHES